MKVVICTRPRNQYENARLLVLIGSSLSVHQGSGNVTVLLRRDTAS
jgi:hypothetical protein